MNGGYRRAMVCILLAVLAAARHAYGDAMVGFAAEATSVSESNGVIGIRLVADAPVVEPVRVVWSFGAESTATPVLDVDATTNGVVIPVGDASVELLMHIVDDRLVEPQEEAVIAVTAVEHGVWQGPAIHKLYIRDNDLAEEGGELPPLPRVRFAVPEMECAESARYAGIRVLLDRPATAEVSVVMHSLGGSACETYPSVSLHTEVVFAAGSGCVTVPIVWDEDQTVSSNKSVTYGLTGGSGAEIGVPDQCLLTITNDDKLVLRNWDDQHWYPIPGGEGGGSGTNEVTMDNPDVCVDLTWVIEAGAPCELPIQGWIYNEETQDRDEWTATQERYGFTNDNDMLAFYVDVCLDMVEGENDIVFTPTNPPPVPRPKIVKLKARPPEVREVAFASSQSDCSEQSGVTNLELRLNRTTTNDVLVSISTSGRAEAGSDYQLPNYVLFPAGSQRASLPVTIINDNRVEGNEDAVINIASATGARIGSNRVHTIWIHDDDAYVITAGLAYETYPAGNGDVMTTTGPRTSAFQVRGLAVDAWDNEYISDWGPGGGESEGSIWMRQPDDHRVYQICSGLTRPGDVELWPDGRGFVVIQENGSVISHGFGLSVCLLDPNGRPITDALVHVSTDGPDAWASVGRDGFYHLLDLQTPATTRRMVDIVVRHNGRDEAFRGISLERGDATVSGHVLCLLPLEN